MTAADGRPASGRADKPMAFPKRRGSVASQVADGEAVLLDIESGKYFSLNLVGSRIWELCDGTRTAAEIISIVCDEFLVTEDMATADTYEFLGELQGEKLFLET